MLEMNVIWPWYPYPSAWGVKFPWSGDEYLIIKGWIWKQHTVETWEQSPQVQKFREHFKKLQQS